MSTKRKLSRAQSKVLDARRNPPDKELKCKCGLRILMWDKERRIMHQAPECKAFTDMMNGVLGHSLEGPVTVIENGDSKTGSQS
jgi:hypothetical protein